MPLPRAVEPAPSAERRCWQRALAWLPGCVLGLVLALLLALTSSQRLTEPVQPSGQDSLIVGSTLASDRVAALAMDIGEHLSTVVGAKALPPHPDPEMPRMCVVEDGQGFALVASDLVVLSANRSTRRSPPADTFSSRNALRLDRPPQPLHA